MSIEAAHNPEEDNVLSTPNLTIEKIDELLLKGDFLSNEEGEMIRSELLFQRNKILQ